MKRTDEGRNLFSISCFSRRLSFFQGFPLPCFCSTQKSAKIVSLFHRLPLALFLLSQKSAKIVSLVPRFPLAFPSCQVLLAQNLAKKIQPFKRLNLSGLLAELPFKGNLGKQRVAKLSPFLPSPCPATAQMQFRQSKTQSAENELSSKTNYRQKTS